MLATFISHVQVGKLGAKDVLLVSTIEVTALFDVDPVSVESTDVLKT